MVNLVFCQNKIWRVYRRLLKIIRPPFDCCWWDLRISCVKWWCSCWIGVKCNPGVLLFCIDFCMVWLLPKKCKNHSFFFIMLVSKFVFICFCYFFISKFHFRLKLCFLSQKMFFWSKSDLIFLIFSFVFPKNDENNIINESNTIFFVHFFLNS